MLASLPQPWHGAESPGEAGGQLARRTGGRRLCKVPAKTFDSLFTLSSKRDRADQRSLALAPLHFICLSELQLNRFNGSLHTDRKHNRTAFSADIPHHRRRLFRP